MEKTIVVAARPTQVCLAVYKVDEDAGSILFRDVVSWIDGVPMVTDDTGTLLAASAFSLEEYTTEYVGFADSPGRILELVGAIREEEEKAGRDEERDDRKRVMRSTYVQELLEHLDVPFGCREHVVDALVHVYGDGTQNGMYFFTSPDRAALVGGFVRAVMDGLTSRGLR